MVAILNTIPRDKEDVLSSARGGGWGQRWVRERGRKQATINNLNFYQKGNKKCVVHILTMEYCGYI